jgi:L-lactate dehydrogenase complex protein LldG
VTLISGPSKTADIGINLVLGIHGPREVHVILLDPPG